MRQKRTEDLVIEAFVCVVFAIALMKALRLFCRTLDRTLVMREEYAVTEKSSAAVGVDEAMRPGVPVGRGWTLVSVSIVGGTRVIFWWKRRKQSKKGQRR